MRAWAMKASARVVILYWGGTVTGSRIGAKFVTDDGTHESTKANCRCIGMSQRVGRV